MSTENKIEITTAGGVKATLNPTITYEQDRTITSVYLDETLNRAQSLEKANKIGIEYVVASLNDSSDSVYDRFKKLPLADAREIVAKVKEILDPKAPTPPVTDSTKTN